MTQLRIASAQRQRVYRPGGPISVGEIESFAPSVFATEAHASRSVRYGFVESSQLLTSLLDSGFEVHEVRQQISRKADKQNFGTHMLRFRHAGGQSLTCSDASFFEIILLNSHAGQTCFNLYAGVFRMVCQNGLIAGDVVEGVKIQHSASADISVSFAMDDMLEKAPRLAGLISNMQSVKLKPIEQQALAMSALAARWPSNSDAVPHRAPITIEQVLEPVRRADQSDDLWTVFNRLQEKLLKGGTQGRSANGNRQTTRPVEGVNETVALNRQLFRSAEAMLEMVG